MSTYDFLLMAAGAFPYVVTVLSYRTKAKAAQREIDEWRDYSASLLRKIDRLKLGTDEAGS